VLTVISCPDCGVPAEITERFSLPSTDGSVGHVAVCCAAGHHFRMAADRLPASSTAPSRGLAGLLRTRMLRSTVHLCVHCWQNTAGFWVSSSNVQAARRPWCLSCSLELDRGCYVVTRFGV
jgi:hypothetical protein